jgi:acetyl esterase/lipase
VRLQRRRECGSELTRVLSPTVFFLPVRTIASYTLLRLFSPSVKVGRPILADYISKATQFFYSRATVAQARVLFNSTSAYHFALALPGWTGSRDWVKRVEVNGTAGRWIAPPSTSRKDDDVVIYHVHGGGFT